ncbi:unnamed protein product [Zymoseptoria tritici ST99CH_1A5]|uniref:N-acetyltransferase domain-containing protein n=1 Tax=Zymoseptoria tritici ST99CH_1A5 TaxID=1276529 RepID=A0A1Y6LI18_ZYMTR|nr:unnamed protein product [Zymoseptoria tritici ST99CH_1A5]
MANLWRTPSLTSRACEASDEPFLAELNTHSLNLMNAAYFIPLPQNAKSITSFREFIDSALLGVLICLPVEKDAVPKPIGALTLTQIPQRAHHRNAGIGINILPAYQGKGHGSEAIRWVLEFAFETMGLHRVEIGSFEYNRGADRLYERLGFVREGFTRESIFSQGRWWGEFRLGMLEGEWRGMRGEGKI